MNAVDTNVFVYGLDQAEPAKQEKAKALLDQLQSDPLPTILLWQVRGEFMQQLRRWQDRGLLTRGEVLRQVELIRKMFPLVPPTVGVVDRALDLGGRYSLSHWDSMLVAACLEASVTKLYTEDMGSPRKIDHLQLVNPFA